MEAGFVDACCRGKQPIFLLLVFTKVLIGGKKFRAVTPSQKQPRFLIIYVKNIYFKILIDSKCGYLV